MFNIFTTQCTLHDTCALYTSYFYQVPNKSVNLINRPINKILKKLTESWVSSELLEEQMSDNSLIGPSLEGPEIPDVFQTLGKRPQQYNERNLEKSPQCNKEQRLSRLTLLQRRKKQRIQLVVYSSDTVGPPSDKSSQF